MKCEGGGGGGGGGGELGSDLPRSGSESMENIMDPNLAKLMRILRIWIRNTGFTLRCLI